MAKDNLVAKLKHESLMVYQMIKPISFGNSAGYGGKDGISANPVERVGGVEFCHHLVR